MARAKSLEMDGIGDASSWSAKASKMRNLSIVKLESISIDPYPIPVVKDVFNINQSFTIQDNGVKMSSVNESAQTENDFGVFSWGDSAMSLTTTMPNLYICCEGQEGDPVGLDDSSTTLTLEPELSSAATFASCENLTKITKLPVNRTFRSKSKLASQSTSSNLNGNSNLSAISSASCSSSKFPGQTQRQTNLMVEKLQSDQWETCIEGLELFISIGDSFDWQAESNSRYSQIVSRKLIDLMRSLRSNVSKIACQIAGDYFVITKSTRRPEFDDITFGLLLKCADSNKFIRLDAFKALEKMVQCINYNHSLRVICTLNALNHKNLLTRLAVAKLLLLICEDVGTDRILNSETNQRTRKLVMETMMQLLVDKDQSTRSCTENLCKYLSTHEHFVEIFCRHVDPKQKTRMMRILSNLKIY